jgi:hypothetical protein
MKPEFWTQGLNSWEFTWKVWPLAPTSQLKRLDEGQRKEIYYIALNKPWEEAK